jgi:hypothetical protein
MRAAPEDQRKLLELQKIDTRVARLSHERRTLPVLAQITTLERGARDVEEERIRVATSLADLRRELARVEDDVDQIRQRAARYQARLDAPGASAKDAQAMQAEIGLLAHRTSVLEDEELEQMERVEATEGELAGIAARAAGIAAEHEQRGSERDAEFERVDALLADARARRAEVADALPAPLVKLYDEIRAETGGPGAVALYGSRLEGASFELTVTELSDARAAAPDVVTISEDHGVILVRMD